jgi:hypothetical protein
MREDDRRPERPARGKGVVSDLEDPRVFGDEVEGGRALVHVVHGAGYDVPDGRHGGEDLGTHQASGASAGNGCALRVSFGQIRNRGWFVRKRKLLPRTETGSRFIFVHADAGNVIPRSQVRVQHDSAAVQ